MLKRLARPFVLLLTAALLTGCTTLGSELVAPSLEVTGVQMLSSDMFAQRFKVRVLVKNPNDLELAVKGLDYQIILMGDSFAEGVSSDQFLLPAKGEAEFDMLITTNFVSSFGDGAERCIRFFSHAPPTRLLVDRFAQQLAGPEGQHGARLDRHFDPGLGIAANPLILVAQHEAAETGNLDVFTFGQRIAHLSENRLDQIKRLRPAETHLAIDRLCQIGAGQSTNRTHHACAPSRRDPKEDQYITNLVRFCKVIPYVMASYHQLGCK